MGGDGVLNTAGLSEKGKVGEAVLSPGCRVMEKVSQFPNKSLTFKRDSLPTITEHRCDGPRDLYSVTTLFLSPACWGSNPSRRNPSRRNPHFLLCHLSLPNMEGFSPMFLSFSSGDLGPYRSTDHAAPSYPPSKAPAAS